MNQTNARQSVCYQGSYEIKGAKQISRRADLLTAFRVEIGRAYLVWFGYADAMTYLKNRKISSITVERVLTLEICRGLPQKSVAAD